MAEVEDFLVEAALVGAFEAFVVLDFADADLPFAVFDVVDLPVSGFLATGLVASDWPAFEVVLGALFADAFGLV